MEIRRARAADLSAVREIVAAAYGVYVERIGRRPAPMDDDYDERLRDGRLYVADDGSVAGLIVLVPASDHLLVENVAVHPARQGEGIGRALLTYAEEYARELGLPELQLYTNAAMTENLAFYARLGYREVDRRTEEGFQRVFFSKPVDPHKRVT
jgi:N-acetylglutamate synthase-like GNAT family acetyltransferase